LHSCHAQRPDENADNPENGPSLVELEEIARRLSEAHDVLLARLWSRRRRAECAVARRARVDAELVRRGLARSRQQAAELIGAGKVRIDGMPAVKPATAVAVTAALTVAAEGERSWVSRGAHKLIGALDAFGIPVAGRRCLDAGASTGGFTEVLLDRGAAEVVAADVGYGQLAWSLRSDPRVLVVERTNAP
jgi:23S rRNA (cytidine1920-2'-O)/16S rRNA (cytidine1409-2'-O)-methyltransferase